jgi:hypothetical protein
VTAHKKEDQDDKQDRSKAESGAAICSIVIEIPSKAENQNQHDQQEQHYFTTDPNTRQPKIPTSSQTTPNDPALRNHGWLGS